MRRRSSNSNSDIVFVRRINEPALLVMTLLSVGILIAPMGYAQEFSPLTKWGKYGTSNGSFNQPHGIATDSSHFYIADTGNNRIQVFSSNGTFITEWGKYGTSNGSFNQPHGIAVIPQSGNILVSDTENNRIQVFSSNGTFITDWGKHGTGKGRFKSPMDIAVIQGPSGNNTILISDTENNRIQVFSSNGTFITEWGKYGTSNGSFNQPHGIAVIPQSGNILVSDTENNRIQVFSSNGTFITDWGKHGTGKGRFKSPMDIAVTPQSGNVYVADTGNNRIQVFSSNGTFITEWGKYGTGDNNFRTPSYIAVIPQPSGNSTIVVSDTGNNRIQSFSYKG